MRALLYFVAITMLFSGCASVPPREGFTTYSLNGTTYLPLFALCSARNIAYSYDTFSGVIDLDGQGHRVNVKVGDTLVIADGVPQHLRYPVDVCQGLVVVPVKFKEGILDTVFKGPVTQPLAPCVSLKIKKIVIDAGHGGKDPGAIGRSGLREKDVALDIAKRLATLLKTKGFEIILTRSSDRFISLNRRVDIANNSKADLFISVHANANRVRSLHGFEVYYVSAQANDYKRALASAENAALSVEGATIGRPSLNLKTILWDMIYTSSRAESFTLAGDICKNVRESTDTRILGIKGANFFVLKGARIPAVLIEIGFLSNTNEERMLRNGYYRQQIAAAITEGIQDYATGGVRIAEAFN